MSTHDANLGRHRGGVPEEDPAAAAVAEEVLRDPSFQAARAHVVEHDERTLDDQIKLTRIPAPPFGEEARGRRMAALMADAGLADAVTDEAGNILGGVAGAGGRGRPPLVASAHLDTVFPEGTAVEVRREGDTLSAPGISDDGRGLAALLALSRALIAAGPLLDAPLLVAATVGEEGPGNLRGARHLFGPGGAAEDAAGFLSLDGAGTSRIVSTGVGSRRLRAQFRGPGGHSWTDWGTVNPIHALAGVVERLRDLPLEEGCTFSVGRMEGGTSVNSIPEEAWLEMEVRGLEEAPLAVLEQETRRILNETLAAENEGKASGTAPLEMEVTPLGNRPAGVTPPSAPLLRAAVAATRAVVGDCWTVAASTDANIPMSKGIQAVTMGAGGTAGGAHTLGEWYENTDGPAGIVRALLTLVVADRLAHAPG